MKVYICSSLKNKEINGKVTEILEANGYEVHLPIRDTPQDIDENIYFGNIRGIESSDLMVAIAKREISRNWAFEVGYAKGIGKQIICLVFLDIDLDEHIMLKEALSKTVSSIKELLEAIRKFPVIDY